MKKKETPEEFYNKEMGRLNNQYAEMKYPGIIIKNFVIALIISLIIHFIFQNWWVTFVLLILVGTHFRLRMYRFKEEYISERGVKDED